MTKKAKRPARGPRARAPRRPEVNAALEWAVSACGERKAEGGVVLDLRQISDVADYFVVVSGTSDTHVRGIAEHVIEALLAHDVRPHHVEGLKQGRWVLLDFVDFVVHVFHPASRSFYLLEALWGDAPQRYV